MKPKPSTPIKPVLVLPLDTERKIINAAISAGYLPILTDKPDAVRIVHPTSNINADDLLMAAMQGLSGIGAAAERGRMVEELHRRMLLRENQCLCQPLDTAH